MFEGSNRNETNNNIESIFYIEEYLSIFGMYMYSFGIISTIKHNDCMLWCWKILFTLIKLNFYWFNFWYHRAEIIDEKVNKAVLNGTWMHIIGSLHSIRPCTFEEH